MTTRLGTFVAAQIALIVVVFCCALLPNLNEATAAEKPVAKAAVAKPIAAAPYDLFSQTLTDQNGNKFPLSTLKGKVLVVDFIFTRCPDICPFMTQKMARLHQKLTSDQVRYVSVTLDPEYDSTNILKVFGQKYGADFNRWVFLTGSRQSVVDLSVKGFKLSASELDMAHTGRFVTVGKDGQIIGYYDYKDEADMARLVSDITAAMAK